MGYEEFMETYKPIQNPLRDDACREGIVFETYGEDLAYVVAYGLKHHHTVWTIVTIEPKEEYNEHGEPNPTTAIISGYHFVDRFGFFITEKPYNEHIEVIDN